MAEVSQGQDRSVLSLHLRGWSVAGRDVLGQVELALDPGETVALVGPSGIGKTSLLRIIAGLEPRFDGHCAVAGRIAMVFQEPTLMPWRSLTQNICIPTGATEQTAQHLLCEVGLAGRGDDFPGQLSLGQQRRLSLARAFAMQPDLLLLDEPFVSLDAALADEMMSLFEALRARHDVTTIFVTHVLEEAARLATRSVQLAGSPATLAAS